MASRDLVALAPEGSTMTQTTPLLPDSTVASRLNIRSMSSALKQYRLVDTTACARTDTQEVSTQR